MILVFSKHRIYWPWDNVDKYNIYLLHFLMSK